jgi:predicted transcriptional regulator of viral defense system
MAPQNRSVERVLARIAGGAHGVVTWRQLVAADVTPAQIKHRLRTGALIREYPGVYRVGHRAPSVEARYLAAVRACGQGALLSGRAAAHLLGLLKGDAPRPEVIAPTWRRVRGITTHRARQIDPRDATTLRRIPVTTVARTLVDLAAVLDPESLARACHEAGVHHRTTPARVAAVLERRPTVQGPACCVGS